MRPARPVALVLMTLQRSGRRGQWGVHIQLAQGNVASVATSADSLRGQFRRAVSMPGTPNPVVVFRVELPTGVGNSWPFTRWLLENCNGATISAENRQDIFLSIVVPLIPWTLVFLFIWFFVFRQLRGQPGKPREPMPVVIVAPSGGGTASTP